MDKRGNFQLSNLLQAGPAAGCVTICEGALTFVIDQDDEAALINLRFALADALELCGQISQRSAEAAVVAEMIRAANIQVMLLMKSPRAEFSLESSGGAPVSNAA